MTPDNVIKLAQQGEIDEPLTEVVRNGTRTLLAQAVEELKNLFRSLQFRRKRDRLARVLRPSADGRGLLLSESRCAVEANQQRGGESTRSENTKNATQNHCHENSGGGRDSWRLRGQRNYPGPA